MFSNWIVDDKEEKSRVRSQGWHKHNNTWYNLRVPKLCGVPCDEKYLFNIPWSGALLGGNIYIPDLLLNTLSPKTASGEKWSMMNGGEFYILVRFWPPHGPLPHWHPPNGENMKAWDWISDNDSNPSNRSHLWVISKSELLMEKLIVDDDNGKKSYCCWREKTSS